MHLKRNKWFSSRYVDLFPLNQFHAVQSWVEYMYIYAKPYFIKKWFNLRKLFDYPVYKSLERRFHLHRCTGYFKICIFFGCVDCYLSPQGLYCIQNIKMLLVVEPLREGGIKSWATKKRRRKNYLWFLKND